MNDIKEAINKAIEAKEELAKNISSLINDFENKTGLVVEDIEITTMTISGALYRAKIGIKVEL